MIGRYAQPGIFAHVGFLKILKVSVAAILILLAVIVRYLTDFGQPVVVGLCLLSLCLTGLPILWEAIRGLVKLRTNVDELVSIALVACIVLGEWITAAIVAFIMVLGGLIEELTSQQARKHIESLGDSHPDHALLILENGENHEIDVKELQPNMLILVRPGDVVPADGVIEDGESELDESMLTGESLPVPRSKGQLVSAGTLNTHGSLQVRVKHVGQQSAQGKILKIIKEAESHRAPIIRVAESYAKWFTPSILILAGLTWIVTGDIQRAVTMLIVGCPCAFVLATPTAVVAALGAASRFGVLIKGGKYLEAAAKVSEIIFDKTGTLTTGAFHVNTIVPVSGHSEIKTIEIAAQLEASSEHPLARAIVTKARTMERDVKTSVNIKRYAGLGVAELGPTNERSIIGNSGFLEREEIKIPEMIRQKSEHFASMGMTTLFVARGNTCLGMLVLEDELRHDAPAIRDGLQQQIKGKLHVLTGDSEPVARYVAGRLEIEDNSIRSGQLPEEKYEYIKELEDQGQKVMYVGDGANDGPALAIASVGVSIGSRENTVALETADVVLMKDGLSRLPFFLELSRKTAKTIRQNLIVFGLLFNIAMLILSGSGVLTPVLGAIGHNIGSVAVVLNSAQLLRVRPTALNPAKI